MTETQTGRVLGVDLGQKRVGLAISNPDRSVASPLDVIKRDGDYRNRLARIAQDWEVATIVIGLPISLDGSYGQAAQRCETEAKAIEKQLKIPVELHDERLSTVAAEKMMSEAGLSTRKQRNVVDKIAASILLQAWLDSQDNRRQSTQK